MKISVCAFINSIPPSARRSHKADLLINFIKGVNANKDSGKIYDSRYNRPVSVDVAILQGWVHENSSRTPHLNFRRSIIKRQQDDNKNLIVIDSNLFGYNVDKLHPMMYHRFSMGGVFPTTANYFDTIVDETRWDKIATDLDIKVKPWRKLGSYILLCCQRNEGWSMKGLSVVDWIHQTVQEIRKHTDRGILVRAHPGDKHAHRYLRETKHKISNNKSIKKDFEKAWATITYNSSPGVASAIEGVPLYVTDPIPQTSQAFAVANTDLSTIESPQTFDRTDWLQRLAMCHWKMEELRNGDAWRHMKQFISSKEPSVTLGKK